MCVSLKNRLVIQVINNYGECMHFQRRQFCRNCFASLLKMGLKGKNFSPTLPHPWSNFFPLEKPISCKIVMCRNANKKSQIPLGQILYHYENMPIQIYRKFHLQKLKKKKSDKKTLIFFIFLLKNKDCRYSLEPPRRGGSNDYPQFMFLSRNKKHNVYPCKPQFYNIKVGFKGVKNYIGVFS